VQSQIQTAKTRYGELIERIDHSTGQSDLSPQETAELQVLDRKIKQLETDLANLKAELPPATSARDNIKTHIEAERQRHNQVMDDDRPTMPKPTSEEIQKMPLRAKYTELTGKPAPESAK
jgi:hypothetical protein